MAEKCVRVDPSVIKFNDVQVGQVHKIKVTATNVGKNSQKIIFEMPPSKLFKFTHTSSSVVVVPGLYVSGLLEFRPDTEEHVRNCLLIHIDTDTIEVPILVFPRACCLTMNPVVDFGCVAATSQIISKHHSIINQGLAPGTFQVEGSADPFIKITPSNGVVPAGATQWIKVELNTDRSRQIDENILVKLQNHTPVALNIRAKVVDPHLQICDLQGAPLSCLWFGPVYFGTSSVEKIILRNSAPQACDWVCVLQDSASGTEVGTDLQRSTTADTPLLDGMKKCSHGSQEDAAQVFMCFPKQGRLEPYDKTTVTLCFSPVCKSPNKEKQHCYSSRRQDYCLFLLFESVSSKHGFTRHAGSTGVELAVTGSGLPVSLIQSPSQNFNFLTCVTGQCVDLLCALQNRCTQLPVNFRFRKLPHFSTNPSIGTISPGQCQNIILSFSPRQQGTFRMLQKVDVFGHVSQQRVQNTSEVFAGLQLRTFYTLTLHLSAVCRSEATQPLPKLTSGITPKMTNTIGLHPYIRSSDFSRSHEMVPAASLVPDKTQLHKHHREKIGHSKGFVAFSNDRGHSTRSPTSHRQCRTICTDVPRQHYVDTSCAFTEVEKEQRKQHCQIYADFFKQRRQTRLQKLQQRQQQKVENDVNIGIVPSQGLLPPKLRCKDFEKNIVSLTISKSFKKASGNSTSIPQQITNDVSEVIKAVPFTSQEVAECSRSLTAQELYQVIIGPLLVDFGEVCVQSVCVQTLEMINHLSVHVWVQLEVDCPELQGSYPVSHVLPPHCHSALTLTFQSNKLGEFYRTVPYTVNKKHPGQILVQAKVVPVALELSTDLVVLHSTPTWLARSGYRSSVTLKNRRNHAAEFTWKPVVTENGILFSIRPATGVVEAYKELDCEVVWHSSFSSPLDGDFDLCVYRGNKQRLHCIVKIGCTSVQLAEKKRVTFESVPLNMTSVKTAVLHNSGPNHAFYQVLDVCPLPGMVVSPTEGMVPRGGQAVINIHFNPHSVIRFDTPVEIALKGMESVGLRVGGSVEPPNVEISVSSFQLYGVYLGSRQSVPFTLTNHSSAPARVTFNLSEHTDFSVQPPEFSMEPEPGVTVVEIEANQKVNCSLVFCPTQVASHYFDLPMTVNGVIFSSAFQFSFPPLPSTSSTSCSLTSNSSKATIRPVPLTVSMETGSRHVEATVLCAPLEMSPLSLHFNLTYLTDTYSKTVTLRAEPEGKVCWSTLMKPNISWWIDCSAVKNCTIDEEDAVCTVSPSSGRLGPDQSICLAVSIRPKGIRRRVSGTVTTLTLPLYLGEKLPDKLREEEGLQRYRELSITIHHLPSITVHPPQLLLTPVPLGCNMVATLSLMATGYTSGTQITAKISDVEQENRTKQLPLSVTFPQGTQISAEGLHKKHAVDIFNNEATSLICNVSFCSHTPVTLSSTITFSDHLQNRVKVKVWAVADNCLLTVWPYLALHRSEQQIVLKAGATAVEAVLQNFDIPSLGSCQTFSSSSAFGHSSSINKMSGTDSFPGSNGVSGQTSSDRGFSSNRETPVNCGVPEFHASNSGERLYYQSVLVAVERWFSLFGWANGPHPISVPHTLRRVASKIQTNHPSGQALNKSSRSVVDMLIHLTGKQVPGIPHSQSISDNVHQRTTQLIQQYKTILEFLRVQGAGLCYIRPEYLLDKNEFNHWCFLQLKESDNGMDYSSVDYESMSKRSWTDLLLRIYKVFVLCRVSVKDLNTAHQKNADAVPTCLQPLASNVYSGSELQLLSWLNVNYESTRKTVWSTEDIPSARWIVNFDLDLADGLVLAAVLAAYCPYLICSHFKRMYTKPSSMEQILHNNIIVVQALTILSLNIDIYPTDLLDPNPVQMLMLCVHLNKKLPQYQPTQTITLSGELHSTISKQVHLKSPTSKPIKYKALLLGEDAHLFSLPDGLSFTIPAKGSTELTIEYSCAFLRPKEAALLLFSSSTFGKHGALAFHLKTCVTHISPTQTVECSSPCYKLKLIQLPITNPFQKDGNFKVMLVESVNNPLEMEKQQAASESNPLVQKMTDKTCCETEGASSDPGGEEDSEFSCAESNIFLESGQADTLNIDYLPFSPANKYCSVLLTCPQVGDVVYMVKATAELPLPLPFTAKHSQNIIPSDDACVSVLSLRCKVGQTCQEIICLPIINMAWEQALAIWGQRRMSADELRRRSLTHTLHSSSVRAATAAQKLGKQQAFLTRGGGINNGLQYSVEVCMPQYFSLPSTVTIPVYANVKMPWENPADCGCVEIPLRFQADSVGKFMCKMVLRSWCDSRVYMLEAMVTAAEESSHLNFSTPAHRSVTQYIPLHNERDQDLKMQAEVCGEGFSGPEVFTVAAGTKACYPLTFQPATQRIVMGKLTLHNDCNGTEHVFTLRGVGERPLAVDHLLLHCPVRKNTGAKLNVPNYTKTKLSLKVETDLSFVSGPAYLKVKPSETAHYTLTISPWKRGTQNGCVSFVETDKQGDEGLYEVYFTLEIICEPTEPVKIINAQCVIQSNVAIEIPINNPHEEQLDLDVFLEGDGLSGNDQVSLPPHETLIYKAMFSTGVVGKSTGSVVFQSAVAGEFWYDLDLYALPLPVVMLPETCCQLGKWTRLTLPLVNPTSEPVELTVFNSNPRNYALEMDSENTLILEPHSSTQLGVHFSPSSIGEGNHRAKITFSCPQLQEWCFSLSGCGLNPECEEPVSISSKIGSNASICIPFTNPTELQAVLNITLTDKNPKVDQNCNSGAKDRNVFTIPMIQTEGVQIDAGASIDVPVVFTPTSMEIQKAWLCITLTLPSNSSTFTTSSKRSAPDLSTICWIYPLCGIPTEVPVENPPLGIIQCEAGCQLEKKVVVLLAGCVLGNQGVPQVIREDFLCEVRSKRGAEHLDVEDCLSASVELATKDPDSGIIKLTLHLIYSPLKPCKSQYKAVLTVKCVSGGSWEFPVTLIATKPVFDDVIHIEAPESGKTSAVGFRLTSTTRRPEPFSAAFLAGSSGEFTVTPASGMLPPIDSGGVLITVSFTPSSYNKTSRARLQIKAADMQWTYEVKGNPPQNSPSLISASTKPSSSIVPPADNSQKNFVVHNLHIPGLANSSPFKIRR